MVKEAFLSGVALPNGAQTSYAAQGSDAGSRGRGSASDLQQYANNSAPQYAAPPPQRQAPAPAPAPAASRPVTAPPQPAPAAAAPRAAAPNVVPKATGIEPTRIAAGGDTACVKGVRLPPNPLPSARPIRTHNSHQLGFFRPACMALPTNALIACGPLAVPQKSLSGIVVAQKCVEIYSAMKTKNNCRYLIFRIDDGGQMVVPDSSGPPSSNLADLAEALPENDCRYAVYDFKYVNADSCEFKKIIFVLWSPNTSKARERTHDRTYMMHPQAHARAHARARRPRGAVH